ncbi:MAG: branched chain amino acid aminotransferase [Nitrospirae bacterium GWC2_57_13]|jgi:branched-chain amino acid aminotransferase|nr:MAG: branched chain amino acid aminotransferase [Nitrospirae bacterium GWC1_57_7]OGW27620.1 MAG: branched chain amino acid aminotransferase [Nitrospirae bacterium GWC2_57_13]OGW45267.1 MAG: branched chain amino acid aminotransferase [Nitrospirae bacterium GWD2_57_8]HAR45908.1 branched chain amino acid aminotransferase [Nitrospiraceae bacterium]
MLQATEKIWMNGKLVAWDDARVHVLTHSLHYGTGVFEGIRCYKAEAGSAVFRLREHVERLFDSAHICQLDIPYTPEAVTEAILETIRVNKIEACYIRPIAYIGYGAMGIFPKENPVELVIAVWPWGSYLGDEGLKNGIRVKISSFVRPHVNATMVRSKTTANYANSLLAKREALRDGYHEAVLLDTDGYVAEGSGENIFIVRKGFIKTPPLTAILEGITRETVMQLAAERGIRVVEERFTRDELYLADEAFFTGTAAEITPIREVDNRAIGAGKPGPVTTELQAAFFDIVHGRDSRHEEWLTYVHEKQPAVKK